MVVRFPTLTGRRRGVNPQHRIWKGQGDSLSRFVFSIGAAGSYARLVARLLGNLTCLGVENCTTKSRETSPALCSPNAAQPFAQPERKQRGARFAQTLSDCFSLGAPAALGRQRQFEALFNS